MASHTRNKARISVRDMTVFAMLGALMFVSKLILELAPNIHLLGALTVAYTVVYRAKALIPLYIYVMLNGAFAGFDAWWIPYLYIWTVLWGLTMLLPKKTPLWLRAVIYPLLCGLHGMAFGALYAPVQAIIYNSDLKTTLAWIAEGIPFDILHCLGNLAAGLLVLPISQLLFKLERKTNRI